MKWNEHFRRSIKLLLASGLHYSGLLGIARDRLMRDRALILMYHRVFTRGDGVPDYSPNGMSVTPGEFRMHMQFIRRHYDLVSLEHVVAALRGEREFSHGMCVVTFDDGWRCVYQHAFPVLREMSIPAMVFLTTGFVDGTQWFWEERIKYLLAVIYSKKRMIKSNNKNALTSQLAVCGLEDVLGISDSYLPQFVARVAQDAKKFAPERRSNMMELLERLVVQLEPERQRVFMSVSEIEEMASHGIEFGNHTISHPNLTELSSDSVRNEWSEASARIEDLVGRKVDHFAYPYGKNDAAVRLQVENEGARSACTTRYGLVGRADDPYALNRVNMCSEVAGLEPLFAARILGL